MVLVLQPVRVHSHKYTTSYSSLLAHKACTPASIGLAEAAETAAQCSALAPQLQGRPQLALIVPVYVRVVLPQNPLNDSSRYACLGKLCLNSISFVSRS